MKKITLILFTLLLGIVLNACRADVPDLKEYNLRNKEYGNINVQGYSILRIEITGERNKNDILEISLLSIDGVVEFQDSKLPTSKDKYFTGALDIPNGDRVLSGRFINATSFNGLQIATNNVGIGFVEIDIADEFDIDFISNQKLSGSSTIKIILIK